jgi:hypothetical protein
MLPRWVPAWISDATAIEQRLKPHEPLLGQVEAVLFWGNPAGLALAVVAANAALLAVRLLRLSCVPTVLLLLALRALARAACGPGGPLHPALARGPRPGRPPPYGLPEVAALLARCGAALASGARRLFPAKPPPARAVAASVGALLACFLALYLAGTFWTALAAVNLALLLPGAARNLRRKRGK